MIKFTAVIPTYNRADLAVRAVESALAQTKRPFEILVVDDGSTDHTRLAMEAFGPPVRTIHQANGGSAAARHNGISQAQCDWVALLDSDDVWTPTHLEKMAHAIEQTQGQARFYFADTVRPAEKGGGLRWQAVNFHAQAPFQLQNPAADWVLMRPQPMMLQSTVFNKAAYLEAGGFLPALRYRDDTHLFLKLGLDGPVCAVTGVGAEMSADDDPENRLTLTYDDSLRGAEMQVIMFADLLKTGGDLPADHRQELTQRLALAHLSVARHTWRDRNYLTAIKQMIRCAVTQPTVLTGSLQRKLATK